MGYVPVETTLLRDPRVRALGGPGVPLILHLRFLCEEERSEAIGAHRTPAALAIDLAPYGLDVEEIVRLLRHGQDLRLWALHPDYGVIVFKFREGCKNLRGWRIDRDQRALTAIGMRFIFHGTDHGSWLEYYPDDDLQRVDTSNESTGFVQQIQAPTAPDTASRPVVQDVVGERIGEENQREEREESGEVPSPQPPPARPARPQKRIVPGKVAFRPDARSLRESVVMDWNAMAGRKDNPFLERNTPLSSHEIKMLDCRLRDDWWRQNYRAALAAMPKSEWLRGGRGGDPCSFHQFIADGMVQRIINGDFKFSRSEVREQASIEKWIAMETSDPGEAREIREWIKNGQYGFDEHEREELLRSHGWAWIARQFVNRKD